MEWTEGGKSATAASEGAVTQKKGERAPSTSRHRVAQIETISPDPLNEA